jgi:probable phosphoglycerate mutase
MQGWQDSPLSDLGVRQAEALRERLRDVDLDVIYASPTGRAWQTAQIARGDRDLPMVACDALREIKLGIWDGRRIEEVEETHPEALAKFWKAPHRYEPIAGGESFHALAERVRPALAEIVAAHLEETVLIVSHTVTLKIMLAHFHGRSLAKIWDSPYFKPASLSIVEIEEQNGREARVRVEGAAEHLPD